MLIIGNGAHTFIPPEEERGEPGVPVRGAALLRDADVVVTDELVDPAVLGPRGKGEGYPTQAAGVGGGWRWWGQGARANDDGGDSDACPSCVAIQTVAHTEGG